MITVTASHTMSATCGFCTSEKHGFCPRNVLNGDQTTVLTCPCNCYTAPRCVECSTKEGVDTTTFLCTDPDACASRVQYAIEKANERLFKGSTRPDAPASPARSQKTPRRAAEKRAGSCLCCSEPTKGGLFLPGHDSKYLARAVTSILETDADLDSTLTNWEAAGISEGLRGKLTKRVNDATKEK